MPLQIDATVAYGVCRVQWLVSSTKPIINANNLCDVPQVNLVDNIIRDSEYNTYRRIGLPPTAISHPGIDALWAALEPIGSDYLYYLSAKDGTTIFAKTASEQARNRLQYLGK